MKKTSEIPWTLLTRTIAAFLLAWTFYNTELLAQNRHDNNPKKRPKESEQVVRDRHDDAQGNRRAQSRRSWSEGAANFYRPIIENNLFRPLGWIRPSNNTEYTLIGTLIESDSQIAKAFLMERRSKRYHTVTVGQTIGDAVVEDIKPNMVKLSKRGKSLKLKPDSNQFLNASSAYNHKKQTSHASSKTRSKNASSKGKDGDKDTKKHRNYAQEEDKMRDMWKQFRGASPQERRRMIQNFRRRGGPDFSSRDGETNQGKRRVRGRERPQTK